MTDESGPAAVSPTAQAVTMSVAQERSPVPPVLPMETLVREVALAGPGPPVCIFQSKSAIKYGIPPTSAAIAAASSFLSSRAKAMDTDETLEALRQQEIIVSLNRTLDEILARYNVRISSDNMRIILRNLAISHHQQPLVLLMD
jgi:hypothetical protein